MKTKIRDIDVNAINNPVGYENYTRVNAEHMGVIDHMSLTFSFTDDHSSDEELPIEVNDLKATVDAIVDDSKCSDFEFEQDAAYFLLKWS